MHGLAVYSLRPAALESIAFDCEMAAKDGGYAGVVPTIHDTARAAIAAASTEPGEGGCDLCNRPDRDPIHPEA